MTSVLLIQSADRDPPSLAADFAGAGFDTLGPVPCAELVREAVRASPNVVACWQPRADAALLEALLTLQAQQPLPVLVFTRDASVEWMNQALAAGVHAWVVQGYAPQRLRPLVHLAQAREAREREQREALAGMAGRLEERKLVDKAKGILMRSRQLSETEAFQLLRTASMQGNLRVGDVSRQVIDAALAGEAINRAGQQRMLSERLVKLYALACSGTEAAAAAVLMRQSCDRIDDNLESLGKTLSAATFGDLLAAARAAWLPLREQLQTAPQVQRLAALDRQAGTLLGQADALVAALEASGLASAVGVINMAGRQRMLSQRLAKQALLAALVPGAGTASAREAVEATAQAFEEGLSALAQAPLTSAGIRASLAEAQKEWTALRDAVAQAATPAGRMRLAGASEALLDHLDRLTGAYQHSLQVLMG